MLVLYMLDVSSVNLPTDSIAQANTFTVKDTIYAAALNDYWNCQKASVKLYEKKFLVALEGSTIELQQVPTRLSMAAMLPHPSMNDTPSYSKQDTLLPQPVHFFHALIFHFRKQIIIWRMYGVIAEVFDHSLDHSDTWKPFAFSHTGQCLLATDSLHRLARWGNMMLPHQVPYRVYCSQFFINTWFTFDIA